MSVFHGSTEGYEGAGDLYCSRKLMSEGHAELALVRTSQHHFGASSDVGEEVLAQI